MSTDLAVYAKWADGEFVRGEITYKDHRNKDAEGNPYPMIHEEHTSEESLMHTINWYLGRKETTV